jgi:predicted transcriptional regulator
MMTMQIELKKQAYASDLKSRALSILMYLIDRSNKELTCFPAISTMAKQLHISGSTVKRALHELVNKGFIKKSARFREKNLGQTSNLYTLVLRENTPDSEKVEQPQTQQQASTTPAEPAAPIHHEIKSDCAAGHISFETLKEEQKKAKTMAEELTSKESEPLILQQNSKNPLPVQTQKADNERLDTVCSSNAAVTDKIPCSKSNGTLDLAPKKNISVIKSIIHQIQARCFLLISGNPAKIERLPWIHHSQALYSWSEAHIPWHLQPCRTQSDEWRSLSGCKAADDPLCRRNTP